jgi:hypothetical protein
VRSAEWVHPDTAPARWLFAGGAATAPLAEGQSLGSRSIQVFRNTPALKRSETPRSQGGVRMRPCLLDLCFWTPFLLGMVATAAAYCTPQPAGSRMLSRMRNWKRAAMSRRPCLLLCDATCAVPP